MQVGVDIFRWGFRPPRTLCNLRGELGNIELDSTAYKNKGGPRPKKFRGDLNFKGGAMTLHDTMVQSFEDIF